MSRYIDRIFYPLRGPFHLTRGKKLKTEISKGFFYGPPVLSKLKPNNATQFQCYLFRLILVILDQ